VRRLDVSPATPLKADEIKAIREAQHVLQPAFARYLNVSKNLVSDWERGKKPPGGPALRLLADSDDAAQTFRSDPAHHSGGMPPGC
jgi:DNA-binding transcriptional regulator YiaG